MFFRFDANWFLELGPTFLFTDIDCLRALNLYVGDELSLLLLIVLEFKFWLFSDVFTLFVIKFCSYFLVFRIFYYLYFYNNFLDIYYPINLFLFIFMCLKIIFLPNMLLFGWVLVINILLCLLDYINSQVVLIVYYI